MITIIIFDTSGINALAKGDGGSEPLMSRLRRGFKVILTFTNAEELIATPDPKERGSLLTCWDRLWRMGAECVCPPHEIMRLLISTHSSDPSRFDWTKVVVRTGECLDLERAIARGVLDDELCLEQGTQNRESEKIYKEIWRDLRFRLDPIFVEDSSERPKSFSQAALTWAQFWGQKHYKSFSGTELTEAEARFFMDVCPPFRAYTYGTVMSDYNWALRAHDGNLRLSAGRNDLYMAVYLPYCDQFITNDGPQKENLREIASEANIPCEILSLNEFERAISSNSLAI